MQPAPPCRDGAFIYEASKCMGPETAPRACVNQSIIIDSWKFMEHVVTSQGMASRYECICTFSHDSYASNSYWHVTRSSKKRARKHHGATQAQQGRAGYKPLVLGPTRYSKRPRHTPQDGRNVSADKLFSMSIAGMVHVALTYPSTVFACITSIAKRANTTQ